MKISIITPSHNRPENLLRAINSVLNQNYNNWELIIINDSPDYNYKIVEDFLEKNKDTRIKYFKNNTNKGVNYSRNFGIDNLAIDSDFVFFLDDDDQLTLDSLSIQLEIVKKVSCDWLLTLSKSNAKEMNIDAIKTTNKDKRYFNYLMDYLIKRKIKGDYAQLLKTSIIKEYKIFFSKKVKQAEEWIFSIRYSRYAKPYVENIITLEKEYMPQGISENILKMKIQNIKNLFILSNEIFWEGLYPLEKFYILIKVLRSIQKLIF